VGENGIADMTPDHMKEIHSALEIISAIAELFTGEGIQIAP
jgi:hypothetical protein